MFKFGRGRSSARVDSRLESVDDSAGGVLAEGSDSDLEAGGDQGGGGAAVEEVLPCSSGELDGFAAALADGPVVDLEVGAGGGGEPEAGEGGVGPVGGLEAGASSGDEGGVESSRGLEAGAGSVGAEGGVVVASAEDDGLDFGLGQDEERVGVAELGSVGDDGFDFGLGYDAEGVELADGAEEEVGGGGQRKKGRKVKRNKEKSGKVKKGKVLPSMNLLSGVRRVSEAAVEDLGGNRFAVFEVEGCDSRLSNVIGGWTAFLNNLEYPVQVLVRQHAPDFREVRERIIKERPEHMRIGRMNDVGNSMLDFLTGLENGGQVVKRRWYLICNEARVMEMNSILMQSGFDAKRLLQDDLVLLVEACLSGMGYGHRQEFFQAKEDRDFIQLNERYVSLLAVTGWPRRVSTLFLEQLLQMGEELDIGFWIEPVSSRESHSRLQMQRSRFEGNRMVAEQKGRLVSPDVENAIMDISRISDSVSRGVSRLYRRSWTVAVYGRDRESLVSVRERVAGHFRSTLAGVRVMKFRQGRGFASVMPTVRQGDGNKDLTDTDTMLRLFPFTPHDMDKRAGSLLGMDMRSRTPIMYDPFDPKSMNGHMVVMARSGAGKSFLTKLRVLRESQRNIPIYLIDPEGEYGVITRALGGEVFVPGAPGHGLNPFALGYVDQGDLTKRIASLGSLVGVMLEGRVDSDLKASIDRALIGFYARELAMEGLGKQLGTGGMAAFHEYLLSGEAEEFGGSHLAHLLSTFATGSARFLMRGDARDLMVNEAPVTSFNMKNLTGGLKPVAISVCAEVVWGLAVTNPRPRLMIVDECWTVLGTPSGAESLINMVKRARKYQLGLMTITQDVQDFLAENSEGGVITGHAGRSLLQNSASKLALSQDPGALPQVVEALGLGDDVGAFLASALRGQGVLINEAGSVFPMEIVSTALERDVVLDDSWRQDGGGDLQEDGVDPVDLAVNDLGLGSLLADPFEDEQELRLETIMAGVQRELQLERASDGLVAEPD